MRNTEFSQTCRVVLWGRDDLLARAVHQVLEADTHWEVIKIAINGGIENLLQEARRLHPEVVVLCLDRVDEVGLPIQLILSLPSLRVVAVGMESNRVNVYSKQNFILQRVSDLLSVLDGGHS